ncbi:Enoyl-CoA delta isomerase 3 [Diplonema papillatum]|nr:Enoyl-CoA delta isomerase 3 [Diplonema papillatum]|eukprot:gene4723-7255_t
METRYRGDYLRAETTADGILLLTFEGEGLEPWGTKREEHRLTGDCIREVNDALDYADEDASVRAVALTGGGGKYWSNGFDLTWMQASGSAAFDVQQEFEKLLARILVFPVPTLAVLNGHATAAGSMLALAFDYRIMRRDRGYFFMPAGDYGLVPTPGMTELMRAKTPSIMHTDLIVYAVRYTAADLLANAVISSSHDLAGMADAGFAFLRELLGRRPPYPNYRRTLKMIKVNTFYTAHHLLSATGPNMGFNGGRSSKL